VWCMLSQAQGTLSRKIERRSASLGSRKSSSTTYHQRRKKEEGQDKVQRLLCSAQDWSPDLLDDPKETSFFQQKNLS